MTAREADEDAIEFVGIQVEIGNRVIHDHIHHRRLFSLGCTLDTGLIFAWFFAEGWPHMRIGVRYAQFRASAFTMAMKAALKANVFDRV